MTTKRSQIIIELPLDYRVGQDEPSTGTFRNSVVPPKYSKELTVTVQRPGELLGDLANDPELDLRPQVHIVGSARALEELGRYFIALARLHTADPSPYGSIEDIQDGAGGTLRLLPRRNVSPPPLKEKPKPQRAL
jgi:hypothetical protein